MDLAGIFTFSFCRCKAGDGIAGGIAAFAKTGDAIAGFTSGYITSVKDGEDVFLGQNEQFIAINFDFRATPLADDDGVALLDLEGGALAAIEQTPVADGDHLGLLGLFLGGLGQEDPTGGFLLCIHTLKQNLVSQRTNGHIEIS
jgi:hypothetical protein